MTRPRVIVESAPAKINLILQVAPRRPDGYHDLQTVFMAVSLMDRLSFRHLTAGRIKISISGRQAKLIPRDGTDLATRAARLLRDRYGQPTMGALLTLNKKIPVAGGMAGGSTDAAAALRGCNTLWGLNLDDVVLGTLAAELGADVPFALHGNVAFGTGRGDMLQPVPVSGIFHWALAFAHHGLSTPAVFRTFDALPDAPDAAPIDDLLRGLATGDAAAVGHCLHNDLTPAALALCPELGTTLEVGRHHPGVLGAILSGSGPTCAFLCDSAKTAADVAAELARLPQVKSAKTVTGPVSATSG